MIIEDSVLRKMRLTSVNIWHIIENHNTYILISHKIHTMVHGSTMVHTLVQWYMFYSMVHGYVTNQKYVMHVNGP